MEDAFTVEAWIKRFGSELATALVSGPISTPMTLRPVRQTDISLVFVLAIGPRRFLVKAFNPADPSSSRMIDREIACLTRLKGSGLVPDILVANAKGRFLATEYIAARRLEDTIEPRNLDANACRLGDWYARFTAQMPAKVMATTWFDYLAKYPSLAAADAVLKERGFLSTALIRQHKIAKNDAFLGNFLCLEAGNLIGIDFEAALFKPMGWDILDTARVLARRFPQRADDALTSLLQGWNQGTDTMPPEDFVRLARCFVLATERGSGPSI